MKRLLPRVFSCFFAAGLLQTPAAEASGSWSTQVGGNLRHLAASDVHCEDFVAAEFMRVGRPVGFGVVHEFFGVVLTTTAGPHAFVTGLNNDTDLQAFSSEVFGEPDSETLILGEPQVFHTCSKFLATLHRINELMTTSAYNDPIVYAAAMVSRPLTGQPCSNMADAVAAILD